MLVLERKIAIQLLSGLFLVAVLVGLYQLLLSSDFFSLLQKRDVFLSWIIDLGIMGPIAIIGLMTIAIVFSPLPSAPIALVAGAAYGHGWGTLYILIGAEIGALIAFTLARLLGYSVLRHWFGIKMERGWIGSQNKIMLIVFASRLMPFLSFDLISYAAGLTCLQPWRFAVATMLGILPASFVLAHFGAELGSGEGDRIALTIVLTLILLAILTIVPLIAGRYWQRNTEYHDKRP